MNNIKDNYSTNRSVRILESAAKENQLPQSSFEYIGKQPVPQINTNSCLAEDLESDSLAKTLLELATGPRCKSY